VYAKDANIGAAIRLAVPTGDTFPTAEVGHDDHLIARSKAFVIRSDFQNFRGEFMPENTRVAKEGLITSISMQIRTADAYPVNF
jgi:hypothetical protein